MCKTMKFVTKKDLFEAKFDHSGQIGQLRYLFRTVLKAPKTRYNPCILYRTKSATNGEIANEGQNEVSDYILVTLLFSMQTAPLLAASWPDENF